MLTRLGDQPGGRVASGLSYGVIAVVETLTELFPARPDPLDPFPFQGSPLPRSSRTTSTTAYLHHDGLGSVTPHVCRLTLNEIPTLLAFATELRAKIGGSDDNHATG